MNATLVSRRASPPLALIVAGVFVIAAMTVTVGVGRELFRPATFGMAFVAGLVTGSHCIGMCGGFVLCYTARRGGGLRSHAAYALAKTISYASIGALCGAAGQAVSSRGPLPGIAALVAGVFLLALGAHLLGWRALPARFRLARFDRAAAWLRERARRSASPLGLGLANGLMLGCGPLLAMYAAAAGTGSALEGAALLGVFGLGTLPVMLASAWIASTLAANFQRHVARWSGPVVLVCGLLMLQRGLVLAETAETPAVASQPLSAASLPAQTIRMSAGAHAWSPAHFVLQRGAPVRWVIDGSAAGPCTARLRVPALDREIAIGPGETVVEFTPVEAGEMAWSCWMGMARGRFTVVEPPRQN